MAEFFAELFAVDWGGLLGAAVASGVGLSAITQLLKTKWVAVPASKYPRAVTAVLAVLTGIISTLSVGLELSSLASFTVFTVIAFVSSGIAYDVVKRLVSEIKQEPIDNSVTKLGTIQVDVEAKTNLADVKKSVVSDTASALISLDELARQVIAGEWGAGTERKEKLEAAGHSYDDVQAKVKEVLAK